ncbi:ribonuclease E inhibitor RraB [Labrys neptuniae]
MGCHDTEEYDPTRENITDPEERLHALAQTHHGRADGWGFFRV